MIKISWQQIWGTKSNRTHCNTSEEKHEICYAEDHKEVIENRRHAFVEKDKDAEDVSHYTKEAGYDC